MRTGRPIPPLTLTDDGLRNNPNPAGRVLPLAPGGSARILAARLDGGDFALHPDATAPGIGLG